MNQPVRPKVGLLALSLELYETLLPGLRALREAWLRSAVIPALQRESDVVFDRAVFRREDIEAAVAGFGTAQVDALLVILATYSPCQLALSALQRTRLPLVIWNTQELRGGPEFYARQHVRQSRRPRHAGPGQRADADRRSLPLRDQSGQ